MTSIKEPIKRLTPGEKRQILTLCRHDLLQFIQTEGLTPGDRMPGERIFAAKFNLPLRVIREFFSQLRQDGIVSGEARSGLRLVKIPIAANMLQGLRFAMLGSVEEGNPKALQTRPALISSGMEKELTAAGASLLFFNLWSHEYSYHKMLEQAVDKIVADKFDALAYYQTRKANESKYVDCIVAAKIPAVTIDISTDQLPSVNFDDVQVGNMQATYLLEHGHTNICITRSPDQWNSSRTVNYYKWSQLRTAEIQRIYQEQIGITPPVYYFDANTVTPKQLVPFLISILPKKYSAIAAINDNLASKLMIAAKSLNIRIPEDMSIIAVDDNLSLRHLNITTVALSEIALGHAAFLVLQQKLFNPLVSNNTQVLVPGTVIPRATVSDISK